MDVVVCCVSCVSPCGVIVAGAVMVWLVLSVLAVGTCVFVVLFAVCVAACGVPSTGSVARISMSAVSMAIFFMSVFPVGVEMSVVGVGGSCWSEWTRRRRCWACWSRSG